MSSNGYLEYLDEVIKSGTYWDGDTEDSVKKSYLSFVKNEHFDIIIFFYRKTELIHAFMLNQQILDEIIGNGLKEIGKKVEKFKLELHEDENDEANKDEKQKIARVDAAFRKATFREKENIREIKITLDSNNWGKEIEQDF